MRQKKCRGCGADMLMVRTSTGSEMPLDAEPDAEGNVIIENDMAIVLNPGQQPLGETKRYMPHFATCPQADRFRRASR